MLGDSHALVVEDGTEIIESNKYNCNNYKSIFIPKSATEI